MTVMANKTRLDEQAQIVKLVRALKDRTCVTDKDNEFHGKIDETIDKIEDFYHDDYHDDERKKSAKYKLDQVRIKSIGSSQQKYQSIKSRGIAEEVITLKNFSPHSLFSGTTVDGNSRIIIGDGVQNDTGEEIDVPHFIINDKSLCHLVFRMKKFFQNKMNDHLPHSESDPEEIKEYIREQIRAEPEPESKAFKTFLIDEVYEMTKNTRTRSTVKNWVTRVYKEQEQQEAGIICWSPRDKRYDVVRRALEHSSIPNIANNWVDDNSLDHNHYIIYAKSTSGGNIEKDLGTRIVAREYNKVKKKAICVFYTDAATEEKVATAQVEAFAKLNSVQVTYPFYDYTYALGQVKHKDSGKLLTEDDAKAAMAAFDNVVEINAAK